MIAEWWVRTTPHHPDDGEGLVAEQFATVDEYLASFPDDVEAVLQELRRTIRGAVPDAGEKISYRIPAMTLDGKVLVYFAGWKDYVSSRRTSPARGPSGSPTAGRCRTISSSGS